MRALSLAAFLFVIIRPAFSIEIETVEKREERGNIGYVDMQKVFKEFPATVRAKENFEDLVRQAEEQVNLRKAEVLRLRNELSDLKISRDAVPKTLVVASTPPAVVPNPFELDKPAPAPTRPLVLPTTATVGDNPFSLPGLDKPFDTTAKPEPLVINIPGVSTAPIVVQPPSPAETPKPAVVTAAVAKSSAPAFVAVAISSAPAVNPAWAELDAKVALKTREFSKADSDFKDYQSLQEKNLLDLEGRRTELLLGKIGKAIQEVAHQEGISVVVDKSNIVFGHGAVDLTEKVLRHLRGTGQ